MSRTRLVPALLALATLAAACDDMATEPSMLDAPRLLALRATPPNLASGGEVVLEALTWDIADVRWEACATAWAPTSPLSCPTGALALGAGNPLTVALPEGATALWIKAEAVEAPEVLPAIVALSSDGPTENPTLAGLVDADGAPLGAVAPGAEVALHAVLGAPTAVPDGADPRRVVSYFTSAGAFDPFRAFDEGLTTFLAPDAPATAEVRVVVRDAAGGTGWYATTLAVEAP